VELNTDIIIEPNIEIIIILMRIPIIDNIIIAGIDAKAHFIIKDTIDPKGISISCIFTEGVFSGFLLLCNSEDDI
tara:strand:- start:1281 stop:1505 length:225 start_codon:yes stop_codon:yes gene_type:complete